MEVGHFRRRDCKSHDIQPEGEKGHKHNMTSNLNGAELGMTAPVTNAEMVRFLFIQRAAIQRLASSS